MENIKHPARKLAWICFLGVILNLIGTTTAARFNLPVFLDTLGTVFIAAIGGYLPGIAVGFFTNLIESYFNRDDMYFGFVSILVALITAFLTKRGYYEHFAKVLFTIPFTIFVTGFFGTVIEEFLGIIGSLDSLDEFYRHFLRNFYKELLDKGLVVTITYLALKRIPHEVQEKFQSVGKMQAPLSSDMKASLHEKKHLLQFSLRTKLLTNLMLITVFLSTLITSVSYITYHESSIEERIKIADGITSLVASEIDPNRVDEFIALGHNLKDYNVVEERLYRIRNSNSDIKYLYVYKIMEDGCHVVFDLDSPDVEASNPGDIEDFEDSFDKHREDLLAGRPIPPIIGDEKYGHLLTIYKPVYNDNGVCTCYAAIDFSMARISDYGRTFISKVIALFSGALIFVFALVLSFIENNILLPVNTMSYCAKNFSYDSEEAREQNIKRMKSLQIKTHDEIENLYSAFVKTTEDSMHYFKNFKRAEVQVEVMNELAHTDSLTGINNKTAYIETTNRLDADILAGNAEFAIIMIDINYLKRVNDTYGHERGNEYLINACNLTTSIFGKENVYRVGGDEFVAVLDGKNVSRCEDLVAKIRAEIEKFRADDTLKAWEKVSAAIGVAYYNQGVDKTTDEVFKRADAQMYKNKLAMKATRKD